MSIKETHEVDDWLTVIATGRCVGMTAEPTANRYPRPGMVHRQVRDAGPVPVRPAWWRDDPRPATAAVVALLTGLYRPDRPVPPGTETTPPPLLRVPDAVGVGAGKYAA